MVADLAFTPLVAGAATKAAGPLIARVLAAVDPISRRRRQDVQRAREKIRSFDFFSELQTFKILTAMPEGYSTRSIVRALESLTGQALMNEILAANLTGSIEAVIDACSKRMTAILSRSNPQAEVSPTEALGRAVVEALSDAIQVSVQTIATKDPDYLAILQLISGTGIISSTVSGILDRNQQIEVFESQKSERDIERWTATYRRQLGTRHGYIEPPDFDRKRKVPLSDLYVAPRFTSRNQGQSESITIEELKKNIDRTVLLGDPGGGKSTAGDWIVNQFASEEATHIPFVVILREYDQHMTSGLSVVDFISSELSSRYQCAAPEGTVDYLLSTGQAVVFFDGLDELIDSRRRREVTNQIEAFSTRYPQSRILVTSRKVGYTEAQLDTHLFSVYDLAGFSENEVGEYVKNWFYFVDDQSGAQLARTCEVFLLESAGVRDLTATPLMLSLLCIIYRGQGYMPKNRPAVYEKCANLLFEKWDESRQIHVELRAASQVDNAVKHLAYWMLTSGTHAGGVRRDALVRESAGYLAGVFQDEAERIGAAREFVDFCKGRAWVLSDAGTTADGEELYRFTHRTFMEYFAAYELTRLSENPARLASSLIPKIADGEWDVVGQLAVQIMDKHVREGAQRTLSALVDNKRHRRPEKRDRVLSFVWRCLAFTHVGDELLEKLVPESMELSIDRDSSSDLLAESDRSLLESVRVLPELRPRVAMVLLREFRVQISKRSGTRSSVAASILATWADRSRRPSATEDAIIWWSDWSVKMICEEGDGLFGNDDDLLIWNLLMSRSKVPVARYIEGIEKAKGDVLENILVSPHVQSFSYYQVSWAEIACGQADIDEGVIKINPFGAGGPEDGLIALGRRYQATLATPWVDSIEKGPVHLQRLDNTAVPKEVSYEGRWGLFVLAALFVEVLTSDDRNGRFKSNSLLLLLAKARSGDNSSRAEVVSAFAFSGEELNFSRKWLSGEYTIVG